MVEAASRYTRNGLIDTLVLTEYGVQTQSVYLRPYTVHLHLGSMWGPKPPGSGLELESNMADRQ